MPVPVPVLVLAPVPVPELAPAPAAAPGAAPLDVFACLPPRAGDRDAGRFEPTLPSCARASDLRA